MTFQPPEYDDDEERMRLTLAPVLVGRIQALLAIELTPRDRELVEAMARRAPKELEPMHRHWLQRLRYRYRRALPAEHALLLNPDDPIVREMEAASV